MRALITGASSGIGEAIARELAARRWDLVLVARSEPALDAIAQALSAAHRIRATVIAADLSEPDAASAVVTRTRAGGSIDALINNAGFGSYGPFATTDLDNERQMIRVNIDALTTLTKLCLPDLIASKGRVLNVASTAAFQPGPLMAAYSATKAYVLSFSYAIAEELAPSGVTVTCLCPGATHTGFQSRAAMDGSRIFARRPMSAETVARQGVDGMLLGRRIVIPGVQNWIGAQLPRVVPRRLVAKAVKWVLDRQPSGGAS